MDSGQLDTISLKYRALILEILAKTRRGHIGPAFSSLEIIRVLFDHVLKYDPNNLEWPDRDRFILSKGHGCLALYVVMAEKGFFPKSELFKFCTLDGILGGHPEHLTTPGIEASTGSLGHGLSIGVGIALAGKLDRKSYRTSVLVGDGECNEGSIWEAAMSASKHRLSSLTVIVDHNKMQCYSFTSEVMDLEPFADKWRSFGFEVREADGHSIRDLRSHLSSVPFRSGKPSLLICHTVKGKGLPTLENNPAWHHKASVSERELIDLMDYLSKVEHG